MVDPHTMAAQPAETGGSAPQDPAQVAGAASSSLRHESAHLHVAGEARYVDDMPTPPNAVQVALGLSSRAHAPIIRMALGPVQAYPGVVCVLIARAIAHRSEELRVG